MRSMCNPVRVTPWHRKSILQELRCVSTQTWHMSKLLRHGMRSKLRMLRRVKATLQTVTTPCVCHRQGAALLACHSSAQNMRFTLL